MQHPHLPFLTGNNRFYLVVGCYPIEELKKFLPQAISIPGDELMAETYPTVKKVEGMHPFMLQFANCHNVHDLMAETEESDSSRSWVIPDILEASFKQTSTKSSQELEPFFAQMFINPTVSFSYFNQYRFYTQKVYPKLVLDASPAYEWCYKDSVIKNDENTFANYSEYDFSASQVMTFDTYFHPADTEK